MAVKKKPLKIVDLDPANDPDAGLQVRESVIRELREQMSDKNRKLIPHAEVRKKYGFH